MLYEEAYRQIIVFACKRELEALFKPQFPTWYAGKLQIAQTIVGCQIVKNKKRYMGGHERRRERR